MKKLQLVFCPRLPPVPMIVFVSMLSAKKGRRPVSSYRKRSVLLLLRRLPLLCASPTAAARFFACTASYASAWLSDPFLARPMRDEAHGAACKLRLNQPISSLTTCHCGESLDLIRGIFLATKVAVKLVVGMMK